MGQGGETHPGSTLWLQEKNGPDSLVLDVWMVVPSNANKVERWVPRLAVICDQDKPGEQRYRLVNKSYGEEVEVVFGAG